MRRLLNIRTLIAFVASLLALSFISIDYAIVSERVVVKETSNILESLKYSAINVQGSLNRAIRRDDKAATKQILLELNNLPMMKEAYLVDQNSQITTATNLSKVATPFSSWTHSDYVDLNRTTVLKQDQIVHLDASNLVFAIYPIDGPTIEDGSSLRPSSWALVIALDYSNHLRELEEEIRTAVLESGGVIMGLILLLSILVHFFISRRLNLILSVTESYARGMSVTRSNLRGCDELAQVSRSVDRLISTVEEKQKNLENSRHELEQLNHELKFQKFALDEHSIVSITDHRGVITYANDLFCDISGYGREELIGKTHRLLNSKHHSESFFTDLWQTISSGKSWQGQMKNRKKDGSFYWVESTIVPTMDPETKRYRYIAIRTNITEEKALSESLIDLQRRNRQMYGIIAHELRTPASAIEMMTQHDASDWMQDKAQVAMAVKGLLHSIDDMKMLVNPELDRELYLESCTVDELNTSISSMVASAVALNNMEYQQVTKLPDRLHTLKFETDAYRVKACIANLIRNSCLHSEGSNVCCATDSYLDDEGKTQLRWTISDNGKGIPHDVQLVMFKAFERGESEAQGTGLGLYIAKSWIREVGGDLYYRRLDPGSEFILTLPVESGIEPRAVDKGSEEQLVRAERLAGLLRVLFVEDDKLLQMVSLKSLGSMFSVFDIASDGLEGLEMATGYYDLILTDHFMPNLTGLEMTQRLREQGDVRPIVSATAATIGHESQELLAAGVDIVLPKPISKRSVLETIVELDKRGLLASSAINPN